MDKCHACNLPSMGEVVLWWNNGRQPLIVRVCTIHRDQVMTFLTRLVETGKKVNA